MKKINISIKKGICILIIAVFGISSCGSNAVIRIKDGTKLRGRIEANDQEFIYLTDRHQEKVRVARKDILKIGHPGTGQIITGAILLPTGILFGMIGFLVDETATTETTYYDSTTNTYDTTYEDTANDVAAVYYVMGVGLGITGAILLLTGISKKSESKKRARFSSNTYGLSQNIGLEFKSYRDRFDPNRELIHRANIMYTF